MKILASVFLCLLLACQSRGQESQEVISIGHVTGAGDGYYIKIIGTSKKGLSNAKEYGELFTTNYIVEKHCFKILKDYIYKNCDPVDHLTGSTFNLFIITYKSNNELKKCYLKDEESAREYFKKLINSLDSIAKNSNDKRLLVDFKKVLKSISKAK